ncbi:MAG: insulinase family protein [Alphaproteobacteria bacterium]|nr:MAG: insulinase family protein [Alphaproteobacteria bacterium]
MLRKVIAGLAFIWAVGWGVSLPAMAADSRSGPEVHTFTLNNGMEVVVIPDHRAPIVTHMVWYRVGSADEPRGYSGIAHFLEHLMFKRTKNLKDGEFSKIVAKNGGQHNAFTSYDYTGYYQNVARDRLELMMQLEADRMANLDLRPDDIATERDVIIEERRLRIDNNPSALLGEQMMAVLYLHHPYGTPVIGWMREMQGLAYEPVMDFYAAHYAPSNAILIVAGDVTPDEVHRLARKYYGSIEGAAVEPRVRPVEPPPVAARRVELRDARVRQPVWERVYTAPSYHRAEGRQGEALAVLSELVGGSPTSRLYKRLVLDAELATEVGTWYTGTAYDLGRFGIYAYPRPEQDPAMARASLEGIEREVEAVLADLIEDGVPEDELERTKRKLVADAVYARDSIAAMAQMFGRALTTGLDVDDVLAWPDRVRAVTADEVLAAARTVLDERGSVTGLLLPKPVDREPSGAGDAP